MKSSPVLVTGALKQHRGVDLMPKLKTHRGAAKRFRATGSGKLRRNHAYTSHILTKKSRKRKRNLRHAGLISAADEDRTRRMLPYA